MLNAAVEKVEKRWEGGEWIVLVKLHEAKIVVTPVLIDGRWHDAEVMTPLMRNRIAYRGRDEVKADALVFSLKQLERYNG